MNVLTLQKSGLGFVLSLIIRLLHLLGTLYCILANGSFLLFSQNHCPSPRVASLRLWCRQWGWNGRQVFFSQKLLVDQPNKSHEARFWAHFGKDSETLVTRIKKKKHRSDG
ncbi:hypothetical protein YC2023_008102 [Brassica napus]